MTFWTVVGLALLFIALVYVVEMADRLAHRLWPASWNRHLQRRERELLSTTIADAYEAKERQRLERVFPPPAGPHGFSAQNERRGTRRHTVTEFHKSKVN